MNKPYTHRKQIVLENAIKGAMDRFESETGLHITSVYVKRTARRILAVQTTAELRKSPDIPVLRDEVHLPPPVRWTEQPAGPGATICAHCTSENPQSHAAECPLWKAGTTD